MEIINSLFENSEHNNHRRTSLFFPWIMSKRMNLRGSRFGSAGSVFILPFDPSSWEYIDFILYGFSEKGSDFYRRCLSEGLLNALVFESLAFV